VDETSFETLVEGGAFMEWAEFLGARYGTPWPSPPEGYDLLLEIDVQGAEQVRERNPDALVVLLLPPSEEVQAERLRWRGEDEQTIRSRVEVGRSEAERGRTMADAIVVNDDVNEAVAQVAAIIDRNRKPQASTPAGDSPRRIPLARRRPTLMDPPVEELLDKVDSKFTLVALSSKRARQINSYYNQLGESLGVIVPPQVTSVSGKPLTIAFEEIAGAKTTYHRTDAEGADLELVESADGTTELVGTVDAGTDAESGLEPGELTLEATAAAAVGALESVEGESGEAVAETEDGAS
jgi:DNA-directed RNA polymerase subunit omega